MPLGKGLFTGRGQYPFQYTNRQDTIWQARRAAGCAAICTRPCAFCMENHE
jgi:hypothetical protein